MWQALDVVSKMLAYDPLKRIKPLEVCSHEFVDEVGTIVCPFIRNTRVESGFRCAQVSETPARQS